MVFSPLHWIPSTLAALIILSFVITPNRKHHKALGAAAILLALLGLAGYISWTRMVVYPNQGHGVVVMCNTQRRANRIFLILLNLSKRAK